MILAHRAHDHEQAGKPRASGDDPDEASGKLRTVKVNPARAGMIRCR